MRVFYGVHLKSSRLSTAFDVIRFISEPDNIRFSHVTMRGPYSRPLPKATLDALNKSHNRRWTIRLAGAGSFISGIQNTVMIRVGLLDLSDLVYKPDYADSVPHITLYDGSDREYASALLQLLYKYDFHQEVEVNTLQKLGPKAPTGGNFSLLYDDFYNYHTIITGISPDVAASIPMNSLDKLRCVEAILNDNFEKISDRLKSHAEDVRQAQLPFETDDD